MFRLFGRPHPHSPAATIVQALIGEGLPRGTDPATLTVVEERGSYAGRRVRYFRVFDPGRAAERSIQVRVLGDLDTHPELVVGSGHVRRDGTIVLARRDREPLSTTAARSGADRAAHGDDEHFVFPHRGR